MRVALVHDWLTGMRGGERVLDELSCLFPQADLYTLVHVPGATSRRIDRLRVHASSLSRWPAVARHYRKLLPLFPWAIGQFRLEGYDLVLSTHHAVAKGVRVEPGCAHLCYCFTPMRYVWDQADAYLGRGLLRAVSAPLWLYLRHFDRRTSVPDRVTRFAAISQTVAERIQRHYGREASVVYPPVDVDRFRPNGLPPEDFYLLVAGFVPYKREDVVVEAFSALGRRLLVVGDGPGRERLASRAAPHVEFLGRVSDAELAGLYARCRALVTASHEDFGLVPVEAQAAGRPVIGYARGGTRESVVDPQAPDRGARPPTGIWFDEQTPGALERAVRRFELFESRFSVPALRRNAERFGAARFRRELGREIDATLAKASGRQRTWPSTSPAAASSSGSAMVSAGP